MTEQLVETIAGEIERSVPLLLIEQPLIKAQAKESARQTQERLIGVPILRPRSTRAAQALRGDAASARKQAPRGNCWRCSAYGVVGL